MIKSSTNAWHRQSEPSGPSLRNARHGQLENNGRQGLRSNTEPTRLGWNAAVVRFLNLIREPGDVFEVFVKEVEVPGLTLPVNLNGFYDTEHFNEAVSHALKYSGQATAIFVSLNPVNPALIARRYNRLGQCGKGGGASAEDIVTRRWLLIDLDPVRPADISSTDEEKKHAEETMEGIVVYLRRKGWPVPLSVDSGNGFHLLYRVNLPMDDGGLVQRVLKALDNRFSNEHVKVDTGVFIPNQLTKLAGTMACKGDSLRERPHRRSRLLKIPKGAVRPVPKELLEQLVADVHVDDPVSVCSASNAPLRVIQQAQAYIAKIESVASSRSADNVLFTAACRLVLGFGLGCEEAFPLLQDFAVQRNLEVSDDQLYHKLHDADEKEGPRGQLRRTGASPGDRYFGLEPLEGSQFHGYVSDFADAPAWEVLKPLNKYAEGNLDDFPVQYLLWRTRRSDFLVPDIFLQQCVGGRPTRNWRPLLKARLDLGPTIEESGGTVACTKETCLLSGSGVRHQHFDIFFEHHGLLENFAVEDAEQGHLRFLLYDESQKKARAELRQQRLLITAYWPALLFGRSRGVGWNLGQHRLVAGIVSELTRVRGQRPTHPMQGDVIRDGLVITTGRGSNTVRCPILSSDREYVAFAGNGAIDHWWGRGYQIVGRTFRGWLQRAGYGDKRPRSDKTLARVIAQFLRNLCGVASDLGLTVAAFHPGSGQWKDLNELQDCLTTGCGRDWLEECRVRIFTEADWLVRWRYFFAKKLGFRWIPSSPDDQGPIHDEVVEPDPQRIDSYAQVREFLAASKMTQQDLADLLECSRKRVSRHLNGKSSDRKFLDEVDKVRRAMGQDKSLEVGKWDR